MEAVTTRPTREELRVMVEDEGLTDEQIGMRYNRTRQAVALWRRDAGLDKGTAPYLSHKDLIPWRVKIEHSQHPIMRRLRWLSASRQGRDLSPSEKRGVDRMLAEVEKRNVVIDYDRELGFVFRPREVTDGDMIIRQPRVEG